MTKDEYYEYIKAFYDKLNYDEADCVCSENEIHTCATICTELMNFGFIEGVVGNTSAVHGKYVADRTAITTYTYDDPTYDNIIAEFYIHSRAERHGKKVKFIPTVVLSFDILSGGTDGEYGYETSCMSKSVSIDIAKIADVNKFIKNVKAKVNEVVKLQRKMDKLIEESNSIMDELNFD